MQTGSWLLRKGTLRPKGCMNIMSSLKQIGRPKTDDAAWSLPEKYGGSLNKRTGKRLTKFGGGWGSLKTRSDIARDQVWTYGD